MKNKLESSIEKVVCNKDLVLINGQQFTIIRKIGQGALASVYLVKNNSQVDIPLQIAKIIDASGWRWQTSNNQSAFKTGVLCFSGNTEKLERSLVININDLHDPPSLRRKINEFIQNIISGDFDELNKNDILSNLLNNIDSYAKSFGLENMLQRLNKILIRINEFVWQNYEKELTNKICKQVLTTDISEISSIIDTEIFTEIDRLFNDATSSPNLNNIDQAVLVYKQVIFPELQKNYPLSVNDSRDLLSHYFSKLFNLELIKQHCLAEGLEAINDDPQIAYEFCHVFLEKIIKICKDQGVPELDYSLSDYDYQIYEDDLKKIITNDLVAGLPTDFFKSFFQIVLATKSIQLEQLFQLLIKFLTPEQFCKLIPNFLMHSVREQALGNNAEFNYQRIVQLASECNASQYLSKLVVADNLKGIHPLQFFIASGEITSMVLPDRNTTTVILKEILQSLDQPLINFLKTKTNPNSLPIFFENRRGEFAYFYDFSKVLEQSLDQLDGYVSALDAAGCFMTDGGKIEQIGSCQYPDLEVEIYKLIETGGVIAPSQTEPDKVLISEIYGGWLKIFNESGYQLHDRIGGTVLGKLIAPYAILMHSLIAGSGYYCMSDNSLGSQTNIEIIVAHTKRHGLEKYLKSQGYLVPDLFKICEKITIEQIIDEEILNQLGIDDKKVMISNQILEKLKKIKNVYDAPLAIDILIDLFAQQEGCNELLIMKAKWDFISGLLQRELRISALDKAGISPLLIKEYLLSLGVPLIDLFDNHFWELDSGCLSRFLKIFWKDEFDENQLLRNKLFKIGYSDTEIFDLVDRSRLLRLAIFFDESQTDFFKKNCILDEDRIPMIKYWQSSMKSAIDQNQSYDQIESLPKKIASLSLALRLVVWQKSFNSIDCSLLKILQTQIADCDIKEQVSNWRQCRLNPDFILKLRSLVKAVRDGSIPHQNITAVEISELERIASYLQVPVKTIYHSTYLDLWIAQLINDLVDKNLSVNNSQIQQILDDNIFSDIKKQRLGEIFLKPVKELSLSEKADLYRKLQGNYSAGQVLIELKTDLENNLTDLPERADICDLIEKIWRLDKSKRERALRYIEKLDLQIKRELNSFFWNIWRGEANQSIFTQNMITLSQKEDNLMNRAQLILEWLLLDQNETKPLFGKNNYRQQSLLVYEGIPEKWVRSYFMDNPLSRIFWLGILGLSDYIPDDLSISDDLEKLVRADSLGEYMDKYLRPFTVDQGHLRDHLKDFWLDQELPVSFLSKIRTIIMGSENEKRQGLEAELNWTEIYDFNSLIKLFYTGDKKGLFDVLILIPELIKESDKISYLIHFKNFSSFAEAKKRWFKFYRFKLDQQRWAKHYAYEMIYNRDDLGNKQLFEEISRKLTMASVSSEDEFMKIVREIWNQIPL